MNKEIAVMLDPDAEPEMVDGCAVLGHMIPIELPEDEMTKLQFYMQYNKELNPC